MANISISSAESYSAEKFQGKKNYLIPFALLCCLFFMWAIANNLNDILLPQFQQAFTLSNFQAGLIQSSFYFGYFIIPIPAGILMKRFSYKAGILVGLSLYAIGAFLFYPAANWMDYTLFLTGLFVIAAGLGCLETAANPFVTVLGPKENSHFRINLAQSFNSLGSILAVVFGQSLILSSVPHHSKAELAKMSTEQVSSYHHNLVLAVQTPYMIIVAIVALVALAIAVTRFPKLQTETISAQQTANSSFKDAIKRLIQVKHWRWAVLSQFCYVGAQTAVWSYLIRYAVEELPNITLGFAANYLTATMVFFFVGRITGSFLIKRIAPQKLLALYAALGCLTCVIAALVKGEIGLIALTVSSLFMSIQYPTIFSLGIRDLGDDTKYASSIIVMTIVGGGVVTPVMGYVSDLAGNIPTSELIPALCFAVIFIFANFKAVSKTA